MFRKHPDVVAIVVMGLVLLVANAPRMVLQNSAVWGVKPLKLELPHEEIRAHKDEIRREIRENMRQSRDDVRSALEEARRDVREALKH